MNKEGEDVKIYRWYKINTLPRGCEQTTDKSPFTSELILLSFKGPRGGKCVFAQV